MKSKNNKAYAIFKWWFASLILLLTVCPVSAHNSDKVFQETRVFMKNAVFTIQYHTDYGEILANVKTMQADKDQDGMLSSREKTAFLQKLADDIQSHLKFSIDGVQHQLRYTHGRLHVLDENHLITRLMFEVSANEPFEGEHTVSLSDGNFPGAVLGNMRFAVHAGPGSETVQGLQNDHTLTWRFLSQKGLPGDPKGENEENIQTTKEDKNSSEVGGLTSLIKKEKLSGIWVLFGLIIAAGIGALHALSPGHGKTMVAAYLVGTKGKVSDAIILGSTVTLTHVASVIVLGFVALFLSEYILPQQLYPWLGTASGVMIACIGFWMLTRVAMGMGNHGHRHNHALHHHDHNHDIHEHFHEDHDHDHDHTHSHLPKGGVSFSSLIALGISGGMVPCPSALVILLAAISMHRILLGLGLIFAFSLGLASVLIIIGIIMVKSTGLITKARNGKRLLKILPAVSATAIIVIGIGITFSALVSANIIHMN
jgi:nickel/cobalt exporter